MKHKPIETIIAEFIRTHTNPQMPMTGRIIGNVFGLADSEVRKYINIARRDGEPICSSYRGYYYSSNPDDIKRTIDSIKGRINAQTMAIEGLKMAYQTRI